MIKNSTILQRLEKPTQISDQTSTKITRDAHEPKIRKSLQIRRLVHKKNKIKHKF